jgi:hypothetical protein
MNIIMKSCFRKICHSNYLIALRHAARIPDNERVVVYPCNFCGGMHVGHLRQRPEIDPFYDSIKDASFEQLDSRIKRTKLRLARAQQRLGDLRASGSSSMGTAEQSLSDLSWYLAMLESVSTGRDVSPDDSIARPHEYWARSLAQQETPLATKGAHETEFRPPQGVA